MSTVVISKRTPNNLVFIAYRYWYFQSLLVTTNMVDFCNTKMQLVKIKPVNGFARHFNNGLSNNQKEMFF